MLEILEHVLHLAIEYGVITFKFLGVIVLFVGTAKALFTLATNDPKWRIVLFKNMSSSLNLLLGAEILETVASESFESIGHVACVFALRVAITLLIVYESNHAIHELHEGKEHEAE